MVSRYLAWSEMLMLKMTVPFSISIRPANRYKDHSSSYFLQFKPICPILALLLGRKILLSKHHWRITLPCKGSDIGFLEIALAATASPWPNCCSSIPSPPPSSSFQALGLPHSLKLSPNRVTLIGQLQSDGFLPPALLRLPIQ